MKKEELQEVSVIIDKKLDDLFMNMTLRFLAIIAAGTILSWMLNHKLDEVTIYSGIGFYFIAGIIAILFLFGVGVIGQKKVLE